MTRMAASKARQDFSETLNQVGYKKPSCLIAGARMSPRLFPWKIWH